MVYRYKKFPAFEKDGGTRKSEWTIVNSFVAYSSTALYVRCYSFVRITRVLIFFTEKRRRYLVPLLVARKH